MTAKHFLKNYKLSRQLRVLGLFFVRWKPRVWVGLGWTNFCLYSVKSFENKTHIPQFQTVLHTKCKYEKLLKGTIFLYCSIIKELWQSYRPKLKKII